MKIKRCIDCRRFLGEDNFPWRNKKKSYRISYCKRCASNRTYLWRLDNKEKHLEYKKQWYEDNPEYNKQYRKDNKECRNEYSKQWKTNNPDKVNVLTAKRKAVKKNQSPILTETEKKRVYYLYKFSSILGKHFQMDHYQPISKGGLHHPDNLQILTRALNAEKSDKWPLTPEEKIRYKGFRI